MHLLTSCAQISCDSRYTLFKTIINANRELSRTRYGPDALSLQIAQVGNDIKARQFLEEIDNHPEVGGLVDCTSNYELEADEMMKANPPVDLTPELWLVKMLLGGIDDSYDAQDGECSSLSTCEPRGSPCFSLPSSNRILMRSRFQNNKPNVY